MNIANARKLAEELLADLPPNAAAMKERRGSAQNPHFWIGRLERAMRCLLDAEDGPQVSAEDDAGRAIAQPEHSTFIGHRTIRQADGAYRGVPFGGCTCGWEGPSRLVRHAADQDATDHLDEAQAGDER